MAVFGNELQFYALETKTRVAIEEMLRIVFKDLDADRKVAKQIKL